MTHDRVERTRGSGLSVVYDGIIFRLQRSGGISRYLRELVLRTAASRPATLLSYGGSNAFEPEDTEEAVGLRLRKLRPRVLERLRDVELPPGEPSGVVFHSSYYRICSDAVPQVVTVHDFVSTFFRKGARARMQTAQMLRAIDRAQAIICVSRSTADDLASLRPDIPLGKVHVVHHGVSACFFDDGMAASGLNPPDWPYALFVGNREGYKNFEAAFAGLCRAGDLGAVVVGGESVTESVEALWRRRLGDRLLIVRNADEHGLAALYRGAACLIYPSLYEGFGMPVLEAMASGCPVIAVARTAIPEVAGDAALLVSGGESAEFCAAIRELFESDRREELAELGRSRARSFGWDRCAAETGAIYDSLGV